MEIELKDNPREIVNEHLHKLISDKIATEQGQECCDTVNKFIDQLATMDTKQAYVTLAVTALLWAIDESTQKTEVSIDEALWMLEKIPQTIKHSMHDGVLLCQQAGNK